MFPGRAFLGQKLSLEYATAAFLVADFGPVEKYCYKVNPDQAVF